MIVLLDYFFELKMDDLEGIDIATLFKMVKMNTESFIVKARAKHGDTYNYSNVNCDGVDSIVKIICMIHGEFEIKAKYHLQKNRGCKICSGSHRRTQEEFIEDATKKHNGKYDYSLVKFENMDSMIDIICPIHGKFTQRAGHHMEGNGCKGCQYDAKRHDKKKFIAMANEIHGEGAYDYSLVKYEGNNIKVEIICPKHDKFYQTPNAHINQKQNCPKCANEALRMTQEEFIVKARSIHGDAYDYSEVNYELSKLKVRIKCIKHGITFDMTPNQHTSGKKSGCPLCSSSGYSIIQIEWLAFMESYYDIDIQYKHKNSQTKEYRIKNTKWHADGYCEDTNTIYEFHGDYWHGNPRVYDPEFMHQLRHRRMKTLYKETMYREARIKELGYNLVVMWEYDWKLILKTITQYQRRFRATHSV